jgi:hypothetical protein
MFKGRRINAKQNSYGRYVVKESGKILISEFHGNIHSLRFNIAVGAV